MWDTNVNEYKFDRFVIIVFMPILVELLSKFYLNIKGGLKSIGIYSFIHLSQGHLLTLEKL